MATIYETASGKILMSKDISEAQVTAILASKPGLAVLNYLVPNAATKRINRVTLEAETISPQLDAVEYIRGERAYLLESSDWTQVTDSPLTELQKEAWRVYRQALRDMTVDIDPATPITEIVWPTRP